MKTSKLVIGILMIVLSVFIVFQSMVAGLGNALAENNQSGGSAGVLIAIAYLAAGIIYLATRRAKGLGGDIANLIILCIAGITGVSNAGAYSDLNVWGWLAIIIGIGFFIWHWLSNRKEQKA